MIDYKRKVIQLTSLNDLAASPQLFRRRLMSFQENNTTNGTRINATKIVIQDYNTVSLTSCQLVSGLQQKKTKNQSQTNKKKIPILSNVRDNKNQGYRVQKRFYLLINQQYGSQRYQKVFVTPTPFLVGDCLSSLAHPATLCIVDFFLLLSFMLSL